MSKENATNHHFAAAADHTGPVVVLVPFDQQVPLQARSISLHEVNNTPTAMKHESTIPQWIISPTHPENVIATLLLRPCETVPGLYAYHEPSRRRQQQQHDAADNINDDANLRATRLAMACGLFAIRFYGNVILTRTTTLGSLSDLSVHDVSAACEISPDLRHEILKELMIEGRGKSNVTTASMSSPPFVPDWLAEAAKNNYQDGAVLDKLAFCFQSNANVHDNQDSSSDSGSSARESNASSDSGSSARESNASNEHQCSQVYSGSSNMEQEENRVFVTTNVPLCLHCRKPACTLCTGCDGVYFCDPPRPCRQEW